MRTRFLAIACLVVSLALFAACEPLAAEQAPTEEPQAGEQEGLITPTEPIGEGATETPGGATPSEGQDMATAQELWQTMQAESYTEDWATTPKGTLYEGQEPHGALISTYLNPEAEQAMEARTEMPAGAIIAKDNFLADESHAGTTVMYKIEGYNPEHNDWFWASYNPEGETQAAGRVDNCISCHGAVQSNDYIFTFPVQFLDVSQQEATEEDQQMAEELWQTLQDTEYADNWATTPKGTFYRGQEPHGALISTYLNPEAEQAMEAQPGTMPDGAIIVKENYTEDRDLVGTTVMQKVEGYDPEHNDWFWAQYDPDGQVGAAGQVADCISCHGAVQSNDYVFSVVVAPIEP